MYLAGDPYQAKWKPLNHVALVWWTKQKVKEYSTEIKQG